jgi:PPOX class probable F420-dependent enzyme
MDKDAALAFIRHNHHAVLATTRADGEPQMSPVAAGVDAGGAVVVSTRETASKTKNLRRRPRASLVVMNDHFFGEWVQVEGPVEIVSLPEAMDGLVAYYRDISGEHPDWDGYRAAMESERRVLLRLTVERAGPTISG